MEGMAVVSCVCSGRRLFGVVLLNGLLGFLHQWQRLQAMVGALAGNGWRSWVYGGHEGCQVEAWDLSEGQRKSLVAGETRLMAVTAEESGLPAGEGRDG